MDIFEKMRMFRVAALLKASSCHSQTPGAEGSAHSAIVQLTPMAHSRYHGEVKECAGKSMRNVLSLIGLALLAGSTARADELRAAFVDGVVQIKASVREGNNVWPWDLDLTKKHNKGRAGLEEILVSNACGFGEGIYNGFMSIVEKRRPQSVKARFLKGEFCRIGEYVFDGPTILILREWKRKFYIVDSARLCSSEDNEHFLVDGAFMRKWELSSITEDVSEKICFEREDLSEAEQERLNSDDNTVTSETTICFRKGVKAEKIVEEFAEGAIQITCEPQAAGGCRK